MPITNRNPVKQLFITYPQSKELTKAEFGESLMPLDPTYYEIAEEAHKDGSPHLHAVVQLKVPLSIPKILKHFCKVYPFDFKRIDVKPPRSLKHAIVYIRKEDKNTLKYGILKVPKKKASAYEIRRRALYQNQHYTTTSDHYQKEMLHDLREKHYLRYGGIHEFHNWTLMEHYDFNRATFLARSPEEKAKEAMEALQLEHDNNPPEGFNSWEAWAEDLFDHVS